MKEILKPSWDPGRTHWGLICHSWFSLEYKVIRIFWEIFHTYSEEFLYDILQISHLFERIYSYKLMRLFFSSRTIAGRASLPCLVPLLIGGGTEISPFHRSNRDLGAFFSLTQCKSNQTTSPPFPKGSSLKRLRSPTLPDPSRPFPSFRKAAAAPPAGRRRKRGQKSAGEEGRGSAAARSKSSLLWKREPWFYSPRFYEVK